MDGVELMKKKVFTGVNVFLFLLPALILFIGFLILPIITSGYYSFLDLNLRNLNDPKVFCGWDNYRYVFSDTLKLGKAIVNALILAGLSVFIQLPISLLLALVLGRGIKGERLFLSIFFVPVLISTIIIGQLFIKIYYPGDGILAQLLDSIHLAAPKGYVFNPSDAIQPVECTRALCFFKGKDHITLHQQIGIWLNNADAAAVAAGTKKFATEQYPVQWLGSKYLQLGCCFIPILWQYVGYHMLLLYAGVKSVPPELREAAKLDGATDGQINRYIVIPHIKSIIKICVIFAVTGSLKSFDLFFSMLNGQVGTAADVPGTLLYNQMFNANNYGTGSAIAVMLIVMCFAFALIISTIFKKED